uniref:(northern house mosquito) hypothetical protein n=1 Tax=Culex pipiens TaxID=7175 RepID=A0A8D8ISS6_CULPI
MFTIGAWVDSFFFFEAARVELLLTEEDAFDRVDSAEDTAESSASFSRLIGTGSASELLTFLVLALLLAGAFVGGGIDGGGIFSAASSSDSTSTFGIGCGITMMDISRDGSAAGGSSFSFVLPNPSSLDFFCCSTANGATPFSTFASFSPSNSMGSTSFRSLRTSIEMRSCLMVTMLGWRILLFSVGSLRFLMAFTRADRAGRPELDSSKSGAAGAVSRDFCRTLFFRDAC